MVAVVACALAWTQPATASTDQESLLQDDPRIVYGNNDERVNEVFGALKAIGVDRVRVSVFWNLVAPNPTSARRPSFGGHDPASPAAYPPAIWDRFDRIVTLARKHELGLLFTLTGPAPAWASTATSPGLSGLSVHNPNAEDFRDFATAVGRRYSGEWVDEQPSAPEFGGSTTEPLPRVDHWSVWNEPNHPDWLSPLWRRTRLPERRRLLPAAPHLYRRLVDAAFAGLATSGHGSDTILLGETAPRGRRSFDSAIEPLLFLRELYCLDQRYRPLRGAAARARECPVSGVGRRRFARRHPGLFRATGFAHHPYTVNRPPSATTPARDSVPLANIRRLTRALDRTLRAWGKRRRWDVWITEYGYQTAPDPYVGVPFARQGLWFNWAEHIAYRNPRVASMAQFLLTDDQPDSSFRSDDPRHWRTWQSGLLDSNGKPKPALVDYAFPLRVTPARARSGLPLTVFGAARPAAMGAPLLARIQLKAESGDWVTLREMWVENPRGYLETQVVPPSSGDLRIVWVLADGAEYPTRSEPVFVG